jgi:hypothetical protein
VFTHAGTQEPWEATERHRDPHPRFGEEPHHPVLRALYPAITEAFGTDTPPPSTFLLHRAPGWSRAGHTTPVLLLPGANDDATRRFGHPLSRHDQAFYDTPGLMQYLDSRDRAVFGISFSHYHGDNLLQGEHVANAIRRIRRLTGRDDDPDFRVDLVTYSKGAMAARCYLSDAGAMVTGYDWLTEYRGDVRRVVFQCGPLGGLDMPFRYYLYNLTNHVNEVPAPLGASQLLVYGSWKKTGVGDIFSGYWTGQLLSDLRGIGIPHGPLSWTADANFTYRALLEGGNTLAVRSRGLGAAVEAGGDLIRKLNERGLPPEVGAAMLAGTHPVLYDERYPNLHVPVGGQFVRPNDGLVFVRSALHAEGLTARGATVLGTKKRHKNHVELSRDPESYAWIHGVLAD